MTKKNIQNNGNTPLLKINKFFINIFQGNSKNKSVETNYFKAYFVEILLVFIVAICISFMFPRGRSYQFSGVQGEIYIGEKIIAPFTFAINKTNEEYKQDLELAKQNILPVFIKIDTICTSHEKKLELFFSYVDSIVNQYSDSPILTNQLNNLLVQYNINPDENILKFFTIDKFQSPKNKKNNKTKIKKNLLQAYLNNLLQIQRDICAVGILNLNKSRIPSQQNEIAILLKANEIIEGLEYFYDEENLESILIEKLRSIFPDNELDVNVGYHILMKFITPNLIFNKVETDLRISEAVKNVPLAKGTVLENEKIIDKYDKITAEHIAKLNSLSIEIAEREEGKSIYLSLLRNVGRFLMVCLGLSILVIFLIFNRWRLLRRIKKIVLILVIILLVSLLSFVISKFSDSSYLLPVTIVSMLLTIFYDTRRYRVIQEVKGKLKEIGVPVYIATAHHMEDKAETVLLRMIRGTSVAGCAASHDSPGKPRPRRNRHRS